MVKEKVNWKGQIYEIEFLERFDETLLKNLKQVYGFLFDEENNLCIVRPNEKAGWRLPGGGPENEDKDWKDTLIREADEEADIELDIDSLKIIGIIKVTPISENCERGIHYALRVSGKISKINEQTEDTAEGVINERLFINPKNFLEYCYWGEIGKIQRDKALEVLKR